MNSIDGKDCINISVCTDICHWNIIIHDSYNKSTTYYQWLISVEKK